MPTLTVAPAHSREKFDAWQVTMIAMVSLEGRRHWASMNPEATAFEGLMPCLLDSAEHAKLRNLEINP